MYAKGLALVSAVLLAGCAAPTVEPRAPAISAAARATEYMFVQTAASGRFEDGRIYFDEVSPRVIYFMDRPNRGAGFVTLERFVAKWTAGADSFAADPPNAGLTTLERGTEQVAVLKLSDPRLAGSTLSYGVEVLEGGIPARFNAVAMVIDPGGLMQCVAYGCQ